MKHYVINEDKCMQEAYDKAEVDEKITDEHNITANSYINKNNFAVITGSVIIKGGAGNVAAAYPDGFTQNNSVIISVMGKPTAGTTWSTYGLNGDKFITMMRTNAQGLMIWVNSDNENATYIIRAVLMKLPSLG